MTYHVIGGAQGYKGITLSDFDTWLDAQITGHGDAAEMYQSVAWAYRCVQLRANAVAAMPFVVTREGSDDEVDSPWPLTRLLWNTEAALSVWGAFYWLKRANRVVLKELQWLNPLTMKAEYNENGIQGFEQKVGAVTKRFTPQQIVYGHSFNPYDDLGPGVAPLQVALEAAGIAKNVNQWAAGFFEHGAIPALLLHTDSTLPRGEAERIEGAWNRMVAGVRNAWKAVVLQGGLKPEVIQPPVNTLALPELQAGVRAQIATAMGIPQTMLEDAANFATAKEHKQSFILDTIAPECEMIQEVANEQLFQLYGLELQFRPQDLDILQEDEEQRAGSLASLVSSGMPLKLALEVLGYDLTQDQWEMLAEAEAEKQRAQERDFELQKARFSQPVVTTPGTPRTAEPDSDERDERRERAMRSDLRLWERKVDKRGRVTGFESEHIPAGVKALVTQRMNEDVDTAFDFLKAADMTAAEAALQKRIAKVLREAEERAIAAIEAGSEFDYDLFAQDMRKALQPQLTSIATEQVLRNAVLVGVDFDIAAVNEAALAWAQGYAFELVKGITDTTRKVVSKAIEAFVATPGMSNADLRAMLAPTFGDVRAAMIGTTEVTRAYAQATSIYQKLAEEDGIAMVQVWDASGDDKVCPICGPLDRRPESEWGAQAGGPPAHINCRCGTHLELAKGKHRV